MYWYVLFVRTGQEQKVKQFLEKQLDKSMFTPFIPLLECPFKVKGTVKKILKPLFPSYIFIKSKMPDMGFIRSTDTLFHNSSDIVCVLRYSETEVAVREAEKQILISLFNDDYCIESSTAIIEGDRIRIIDGPLKEREHIVRKINRHKRQAFIEIEIMGEKRIASIPMETIKKI